MCVNNPHGWGRDNYIYSWNGISFNNLNSQKNSPTLTIIGELLRRDVPDIFHEKNRRVSFQEAVVMNC